MTLKKGRMCEGYCSWSQNVQQRHPGFCPPGLLFESFAAPKRKCSPYSTALIHHKPATIKCPKFTAIGTDEHDVPFHRTGD
jgi:hypothetical protein